MDNLLIGNVVPLPSGGTSLPKMLSSVLRPRAILGTSSGPYTPFPDPVEIVPKLIGSPSRQPAKTDRIKIGMSDRLHPGIVIESISEC